MTARNAPLGPYVIQANSVASEVFRQAIRSVIVGSGVVNSGDLLVTANGTPNMTTNVAAGFAFIVGSSSSPSQGAYHVYNDAAVNVGIAAADAVNPRNDLVVASVQDAAYSGAANQWLLQVITGTPAGVPADPAVPVNTITLARVLVGANVTTITSGNITDLRPFATALGGFGKYVARCYAPTNSNQTLGAGGDTGLLFNTTEYDPNGNLGSNVYSVPVPGYYAVRAGVLATATVSGTQLACKVYYNSVLKAQGAAPQSAAAGNFGSSVATLMRCPTAGQVISVSAYASGSVVTVGGQGFVYLEVNYAGPLS